MRMELGLYLMLEPNQATESEGIARHLIQLLFNLKEKEVK